MLTLELTQDLSFDSTTCCYNGSSGIYLYSFTLPCLESTNGYHNINSAQVGEKASLLGVSQTSFHTQVAGLVWRILLLLEQGSLLFEHGGTINIFTILFSLTSCQLTRMARVYFRFLRIILLLSTRIAI